MSTSSSNSIVFSVPGQKPDTRFNLFDTKEIHAHSVVLKLYSAFFRKFLDSPDKVPASPSAAFRYEWISEVEEDGTWHVVSVGSSNTDAKGNRLKGDQDKEITAFTKLLYAMYHNAYEVTDTEEFIRLTEMADYYCALRILSKSLYMTFFRSTYFLVQLPKNAPKLLEYAYKLRHPEILGDCLRYIAGHFDPKAESFQPNVTDPKLRKLAVMMHNAIAAEVASVQQLLINYASTCNVSDRKFLTNPMMTGQSLPRYYRSLVTIGYLKPIVAPLLCSYLELNRMPSEAGEGSFCDHFLCGELDDEDLPWDPTQTDW